MDKLQAIKASKNGALVAFISSTITLVLFLYSYFENKNDILKLLNDPSTIVDIILGFVCCFGMLYKSRAAAIVALTHFLFSKYWVFTKTGGGVNFISIIFIYYYIKAIQGTFAYHKIEAKQNPEYKKPSKWLLYLGAPIGLIVLGLIIVGTIMPD